jgi:WhiB family redox-sensing transcriptional regulator
VTGNLNWQRSARCRGALGRDFYPPFGGDVKRDRRARELRAKTVCELCPVRAECLDHAIRVGERYGVWGGLTSDERLLWPKSA